MQLTPAAWAGADATSRALASEAHVKTGHGRFYGDVPLIKGVYSGFASEARHEVSVRVTGVTS